MPGKTKKPKLGFQPPSPFGAPGITGPSPQGITGPPPAEILTGIEPNEKRQGSERLSPVGLFRPGPPAQQLRPSSPFGFNGRNLAATARGEDLSDDVLRQLATLPQETQGQLLGALRTSGLGISDQTVDAALDGYTTLSVTPGPVDRGDFTNLVDRLRVPSIFEDLTDEQVSEARARIIGGAGTEGPEPSNAEILQEARATAVEDLQESETIVPTYTPPPWAPAEQFFTFEEEE